MDGVAVLHLAAEEQGRQRVLQRALDHPLQRPRPVDRIVAGLRQPGEGGVVQLDGDLAIRQQLAQPPELDIDDALHLVAAEPVEDQDLVEAVQEFRPEVAADRSEEHTSELQSLMRISYAVFCLQKNKTKNATMRHAQTTE